MGQTKSMLDTCSCDTGDDGMADLKPSSSAGTTKSDDGVWRPVNVHGRPASPSSPERGQTEADAVSPVSTPSSDDDGYQHGKALPEASAEATASTVAAAAAALREDHHLEPDAAGGLGLPGAAISGTNSVRAGDGGGGDGGGEVDGGEPPDERRHWVPDEAAPDCQRCGLPFSKLWRRRHHCRRCGSCVCDACSAGRAVLPGSVVRQRVCDLCFEASLHLQVQRITTPQRSRI